MMKFDLPQDNSSIIKVIGVGGGGSNAVNHMYKQGIKGVDFIVCNTDQQSLDVSPVPLKIVLGASLTKGRGAGSLPEVGKNAAIENVEEVKALLAKNTEMVFITAGLGGGTGTGAAPIIAQAAKEMGILTVGIVTIPFSFEGKKRKIQAEDGLNALKANVDTLLVISNDKLREIYGNLKVTEAFGHADDVLTTAAKGIADIITTTLQINTDINDVKTVMKDSGVAIMGSAQASGEHRALRAVEQAMSSPLLNDSNIKGARYVLVNVTCGEDEITMDELGEITDYIQEAAGMTAEVIKGYGVDLSLGDKVNVTIIATGFNSKADLGIQIEKAPARKVFSLMDDIKVEAPAAPVTKEVPLTAIELKTVVAEVPKPVKEVAPQVKEAPVAEVPSTSVAEVITSVAEVSVVELTPVVEIPVAETPVVESEPVVETPVAEISVVEVVATVEEIAPVTMEEEITANDNEETVIIEENIIIAETPIVETPVIMEAPTVVEEAPVVMEVPIVEEIPVIMESPVVEETPVVMEAPVVEETSIIMESPVVEEAPVVMEAPIAEEVVAEVKEVSAPAVSEPVMFIHEEEPKAEEKTAPVIEFEVSVGDTNMVAEDPFSITASTQENAIENVTNTVIESKEEEENKIIAKVQNEEQIKKAQERVAKLKELSFKLKSPNGLSELENEPAYKRRNVNLDSTPHSSESRVSRYTLSENEEKKVEIKPNNSFLHDNVD